MTGFTHSAAINNTQCSCYVLADNYHEFSVWSFLKFGLPTAVPTETFPYEISNQLDSFRLNKSHAHKQLITFSNGIGKKRYKWRSGPTAFLTEMADSYSGLIIETKCKFYWTMHTFQWCFQHGMSAINASYLANICNYIQHRNAINQDNLHQIAPVSVELSM